jgi:glycopeptide antibiotics resistance protein
LFKSASPQTPTAPLRPTPYRRGWFAGWAIAYALAIAYASLVVGPRGLHFVALDPEAAWRMFKATPYLMSGSDQRPDWIANLLMLIPLGFLTTGMFWLRRERRSRWLAAAAALCCCLSFVLAIKYLQLFFPPRTVSLNYIAAQSLGSLLGIALFWVSSNRLFPVLQGVSGRGRHSLMTVFGIYSVILILFFLFPFDFVLSAEDLRERAALLPQLLLSWPGEGRSTTLLVGVVLADTAATVPLGVLLALRSRRNSLFRIAVAGFLIMAAVTLLTMFMLSAAPSLIAILYRTAGIVGGASLAMWLEGKDPTRCRNLLARLVPLAILSYVLAVVLVNDLLSPHWRTMPEALAALEPFSLLPFYHHYIVPKAHAAASVAMHLLMFAPIGVMVALRRGGWRAETWSAAVLAGFFSLAIEFGRWLKPGLQPDFSNAIIAAAAAALAVKLTAAFWDMLEGEPIAETTFVAPGRSNGRERAMVSQQGRAAGLRGSVQRRPATTLGGLVGAAVCLASAVAIAANYPLAPSFLGIVLVVYAAALWRWPSLWLAVIPAALPALDFAPWTGWMYLGEPDLLVLVTIGISALRAPPRRTDLLVRGLPAAVLALALVSYLLSVALGLALPGPESGSDNPYLRPDNALRSAKGFFVALALLPFLRERMRTRIDAMAWLGVGMAAGLALVAAATLAERAVFTGLFDFTTDYRVVGTFSSMHMGGGHLGAYIAMALPFLLVCLLRPRPPTLLAMLGAAILAGYALVVGFARAAYGAALISTIAGCLGWAWAARRRGTDTLSSLVLSALLLLVVGGIVIAAFASRFMTERFQTVAPDLTHRESNWTGGLAMRDDNFAATLFGMGLGTYPRIVLGRKPDGRSPTNFIVEHDGAYPFLSLHADLPTYFGQKVQIAPDQQYRLFVTLRSPDAKGALSLMLCEKMLLYSANCRDTTFQPRKSGIWEDFGAAISTAGLDEKVVLGWLRRPVELSLFDPVPGTTIEIGHIRMLDPQGRDILVNGDFSRGTQRWYFTDDQHLIWRIKNQYLMILFEGGVLGLASFVLLVGTGVAGAVRAMALGERMAATVAASLVAFLCSGVFDYLLEAPRLAALFYIVAFTGLTMFPRPVLGPASL